MLDIIFCPVSLSSSPITLVGPPDITKDTYTKVCEQINAYSKQTLQRRHDAISAPQKADFMPPPHSASKDFLQSLQMSQPSHTKVSGPDLEPLSSLSPLNECIALIVWEAIDCPRLQSILGMKQGSLDKLVLLRAAANYQARNTSVSHVNL